MDTDSVGFIRVELLGYDMRVVREHIHLEHDGKLLLVDPSGSGPVIPEKGRTSWMGEGFLIRLSTPEEAAELGIEWTLKRVNEFKLGKLSHRVIHATPKICWPEHWAWKDSVISDSAVDPVARESVYRTLHRVVSKVIISNPVGEILMAKVSRGFFTGNWTLPGGFVDYDEHPREAAEREALEELGIVISVPDPKGESREATLGDDESLVQTAIFNNEGINWVSFTYRCQSDIGAEEIIPKDDEIEEARWFSREEALDRAVSIFDIEAIQRTN
ncbi:MAG: NUDIX hydrolase [Candidatus Thermoplasmatota archaeon]|nr:NUDIX hydrolase [Candidatus Thermoplasmatota archaeon]